MRNSSRSELPGARAGPGGARPLRELLDSLAEARLVGEDGQVSVSGVVADSRAVDPGVLFVAVRGAHHDGHDFMGEAVERGAAAVVVERAPQQDPGVPVVRVPDGRLALAELAAAWHGHPAERLRLAGITGTVGKTSVLSAMGAMLAAGGSRVGSIGSLGLHGPGVRGGETGYTAPDPLLLHGELARLLEDGCDLVVMEVTSHALVQERVHGLGYELGVFTNLLPLEHADYHGSFRAYVRAKRRFLDHLLPGAPLVYNADDPALRSAVKLPGPEPVPCGTSAGALVRIGLLMVSADGTRFSLEAAEPLPRPGGGDVPPFRVVLDLPLLGRRNVCNAALAAVASLCLGARPEAIEEGASRLEAPRRRMQFVHRGSFSVLDDTVGHPDSVSALFEVVEELEPTRVHVAWVVRGRRGPAINRRCAEALAVWAGRVSVGSVVVSRAAEAADAQNEVSDLEYRAFLLPLRKAGVPFRESERLDDAVEAVMERARPGDLVLLLGAQGMDRGQDLARRWLADQRLEDGG